MPIPKTCAKKVKSKVDLENPLKDMQSRCTFLAGKEENINMSIVSSQIQKEEPSKIERKKRDRKQVRKQVESCEDLSHAKVKNEQIQIQEEIQKYKKEEKAMMKRKRNRNTRKEESVDLSKRRDVVNKAVLRSLRRFLTNKFKEFAKDKIESKDHRSRWYYNTMQEFTRLNYNEDEQMMKELHFYCASIVFPKLLSQNNLDGCDKTTDHANEFYDCIYKYSHTRLLNLLRLKPMNVLFDQFYKEAVENESTFENTRDLKE